MPPYVPRKRLQSPGARASASSTPRNGSKKTAVFDAVDARGPVASSDAKQKFLDHLDDSDSTSDGSSSISIRDQSVAINQTQSQPLKRRKLEHSVSSEHDSRNAQDESSSGSEEDDDEDAWDSFVATHGQSRNNEREGDDEEKDIEIDLGADDDSIATPIEYMNSKRGGPSKRDRQIRSSTHRLHVQCLLYHNHIRNHWLSDKSLHRILLNVLTPGCMDEVDRWRKASDRLQGKKDRETPSGDRPPVKPKQRKHQNGSRKGKGQRDWGRAADPAEDEQDSALSLSHGDPVLRLLKTLSSFWRKRFTTTAPGLRKQGHKSMARLQQEGQAWKNDLHNQDLFGERIESIERFKELAKKAEGSRDVGAQLFTAVLRAVGLEARLVANIQPAGFGWNKGEEADPPKANTDSIAARTPKNSGPANAVSSSPKSVVPQKRKSSPSRRRPDRESKSVPQGTKELPINLSEDDSPLSTPPSSDTDESLVDVTHIKKVPAAKRYDRDLPFPVYWTEVLSPLSNTWIPVDPIVLSVVASHSETHHVFEPRGIGADRAKQVLAYVVAFQPDGSAKDVTTRYLKKHAWPGKTRGVRMPIEKLSLNDKRGKGRKLEEYDWFKHVMSLYAKSNSKRTAADDVEDAGDLKPVVVQRVSKKASGDETLQGYKNSTEFVLERHLRREEAIKAGCDAVKTFRTGKGESAKDEPVYRREDVVRCKTVESWHKEGLAIIEGAQPLKRVPMRAVTTIRKREIEQAERESGEKMKQGLYSRDQTDWIIPPPIKNGIIPKNNFGNIDVYVPTMVPEGAVHVPLRGTAKLCRRLEIDFAEACTGFEFGHRMAVPILTGVVVARENKRLVVDAWRADQEQREKKEKEKRDKLVLGMWKKLYAGLRVVERVRREYGQDADKHLDEAVKKALNNQSQSRKSNTGGKKRGHNLDPIDVEDKSTDHETAALHEDLKGGGFIPNGQSVEILEGRSPVDDVEDMAGGFVLEHEEEEEDGQNRNATASSGMQSLRQRAAKEAQSNALEDTVKSGSDDDANDNQVLAPRRSSSSHNRKKGPVKPRTTPSATAGFTPLAAEKKESSAACSSSIDARKSKGGIRSKYFETGTGDNHDASSSAENDDEKDGDFGGKGTRTKGTRVGGSASATKGTRTSSRLSRGGKM